MNGQGALPSQMIQQMVAGGLILGAPKDAVFPPTSLDLHLSSEVFRIGRAFLPRRGESASDSMRRVMNHELPTTRHDLSYPLERDVTYLAKLRESLRLPSSIYAYSNPKSTAGRNNLQVRVISDGVSRFDEPAPPRENDEWPGGKTRELWLSITPRSFPVQLFENVALTQARFFNAKTFLSVTELQIAQAEHGLLFDRSGRRFDVEKLQISSSDRTLTVTVDLDAEQVGWECLAHNRILDYSRSDYVPENEEFFRPLYSKKVGEDRVAELKQGGFYILATRERVKVPKHLACEMVHADALAGEFRNHFAGYADAGYGAGKGGNGVGRQLVCEVIPYEDILFFDGQAIAQIRFEEMAEEPPLGYDELQTSSYNLDFTIPRLSKHFRM